MRIAITGSIGSGKTVACEYLRLKGFKRYQMPDMCPTCYTIKDFCYHNPRGIYVVGTGEHVVCVMDGDYYDSWDSGNEIPIYYFQRR